MKKLSILTLLSLTLALAAVSMSATTQDFNTYGPGVLPCCGGAINLGLTSLAFPDFTLEALGGAGLQLDAPGYFGAVNYELLGNGSDLTIGFTNPQGAFSIDLRDFSGGYGGTDTITVYATDHVTVLNTYSINLNGSIVTFSDAGEIAPIGFVNLSIISGEGWSGILQSVTYDLSAPTPEPGSLALFGTGILGLAGLVRRKLNL